MAIPYVYGYTTSLSKLFRAQPTSERFFFGVHHLVGFQLYIGTKKLAAVLTSKRFLSGVHSDVVAQTHLRSHLHGTEIALKHWPGLFVVLEHVLPQTVRMLKLTSTRTAPVRDTRVFGFDVEPKNLDVDPMVEHTKIRT